jgi:hypothetical protein
MAKMQLSFINISASLWYESSLDDVLVSPSSREVKKTQIGNTSSALTVAQFSNGIMMRVDCSKEKKGDLHLVFDVTTANLSCQGFEQDDLRSI